MLMSCTVCSLNELTIKCLTDISKSHSIICQLVVDSLFCQYLEIKISLYPELPHRIANMTLDKSVPFRKKINKNETTSKGHLHGSGRFLFCLCQGQSRCSYIFVEWMQGTSHLKEEKEKFREGKRFTYTHRSRQSSDSLGLVHSPEREYTLEQRKHNPQFSQGHQRARWKTFPRQLTSVVSRYSIELSLDFFPVI